MSVAAPINETIFALSSASGRAGVAVMRISGPGAKSALENLGISPLPRPRHAMLSSIYSDSGNNRQLIDKCLVLWFPAPHSFTGEDVAELHLHGSTAVIAAVTEALSAMEGLRLAEPGEFTRRAFDNNKMDLTEIEGLADLINAETSLQREQALHVMEGHQGAYYENLRSKLVSALAHLEATIDFSDEDIPAELYDQVSSEVEIVRQDLNKVLTLSNRGERIREGYTVVLLGAPNAGKSSLLNCLAQRDAAIVSTEAGTTRDIIEVHLDLDGLPVILLDTAGIRENAGDVEQEGIRRALARAEKADMKLVLFDSTTAEADAQSLRLCDGSAIAVLSKSDREKREVACLGDVPQCKVSAESGEGVNELIALIKERLSGAGPTATKMDFLITRQRHKTALMACMSHLERFSTNLPVEIACEELRRAGTELGKITGKIAVDELLDRIFSEFCIGK